MNEKIEQESFDQVIQDQIKENQAEMARLLNEAGIPTNTDTPGVLVIGSVGPPVELVKLQVADSLGMSVADLNKVNLDKCAESYPSCKIEVIKIRVQLAKENRLLTPLTYYADDVTFLLAQLGIKVEDE